ncbi:MAG TPA: class I SAM-dependent methyltransferase [Acidimicrobiales bacterium]|nr:class I SAM-dependent methyltransferase [Acidimicrobiales bacterium]
MTATATATAVAFAGSGLLRPDGAPPDGGPVVLRSRCGRLISLHPERWHAAPPPEEVAALAGLADPVIDLACGPGRLVRHLLDAGVRAMGVDTAPDAVAAARHRGVPALQADLWSPLPGEGAWGAVLLFDGNIGIGADPVALLARCRRLLAPGGTVVAEVGPPGSGAGPLEVRIERGSWASHWFPWAVVGADDIDGLAGPAGFEVRELRGRGFRRFAHLAAAR